MSKSIVYFTKDTSPLAFVKIYNALGIELKGKVAVKLSMGEPGGHNYLKPDQIKPIMDRVNGTIIECSTAYGGKRDTPDLYDKVARDHGFKPMYEVDIMDKNGEIYLPLYNGKHLEYQIAGKNFDNYDSMLVLSHFKGHAMGGFGGAFKNMAIGIASHTGKLYVHSAGKGKEMSIWRSTPPHDLFQESMVEAVEAVINHMGRKNIAYVSAAINLSVDCDCDPNPHKPEMADIGLFASLDPLAIDKACYDAVVNSNDPGKKSLIERMNSRHAPTLLKYASERNLGNLEYELINLDE